jgi:hypothetical protein
MHHYHLAEEVVFTQGEHAYVRPPKSLAELVELISPSLRVDATESNLNDTDSIETESTNKVDETEDTKPLFESSDNTGSPLLGNLWKSASVGGSSIPKPPPLLSQSTTGLVPVSTLNATTTPNGLNAMDISHLRKWLSWTPSMPLYFTVLYDVRIFST